jgi:hypothetical protein
MSLFGGTFFKDIIAIVNGEKFKEAPDMPKINDGDTLLGEATPLEKACRTFSVEKNEKAKALIDSGVSFESDDVQAILRKAKVAEDIFWFLLADRFDKKIAIRQGWQIVEDSGEECDCPTCQAARRSSMSGGVIVIEVSMSKGKPESVMMTADLLSRIFGPVAGIFTRSGRG